MLLVSPQNITNWEVDAKRFYLLSCLICCILNGESKNVSSVRCLVLFRYHIVSRFSYSRFIYYWFPTSVKIKTLYLNQNTYFLGLKPYCCKYYWIKKQIKRFCVNFSISCILRERERVEGERERERENRVCLMGKSIVEA